MRKLLLVVILLAVCAVGCKTGSASSADGFMRGYSAGNTGFYVPPQPVYQNLRPADITRGQRRPVSSYGTFYYPDGRIGSYQGISY